MIELITRRYKKDQNNQKNYADLIIMDGGIQQVRAAKIALQELQIKIPVVSLVKNDKHRTDYLLGLNEEKIQLEKSSQLFRFLEALQLRVHNFVISGFRNRYAKAFTNDAILNNVSGIGTTTIKKLYEKFESIGGMRQASTEELSTIIKNKKTLERLEKYLQDMSNDYGK
ncbi:hypothetical protein [Spiroplasma clarkii]|nr:hypothetical protein [Spiroplasma clarkii]